ncbi:putative metal-binding motif-containing protein, partial [Pyxidicoccus sp. 3LG]
VKSTFYRDADSDGYGNAGLPTQACSQPGGYVSNASDCNDSNGNIRPGGSEVCDGLDNNCNGSTDEGVTSTYYRDADGDGYGASPTTQACSAPAGYVSNASDCNDSSSGIRPGGT